MTGPSSQMTDPSAPGDVERLRLAIESHRPYLTFVADKIRNESIRDREGVSDLVQQSMMSALASIHEGRARLPGPVEQEVRAWLRRILINTHRDLIRHHRAERRSPDRERHDASIDIEADSSTPESKADRHEREQRSVVARLSLSPHDRQLLAWWFEDNLSFTEIAGRLGCSASGARKACRKAAERFKAAFEGGRSLESQGRELSR